MRKTLFVLFILSMAFARLHAETSTARPELPSWPAITAGDRILVLAPHEDDEALGAGGTIQRALSVKAAVKVVYLTYGDHNEWAFLMYRHSPFLTPKVNREMGKTRRHEAEVSTSILGLQESDLAFLGFPDNGTLAIWRRAWGDRPPLHSLLTDSRFVFYPDAVCYLKPYKGEEILSALERQIADFKPTRILVPLPIDSNPDHRAYYLYLQVALWNLEGKVPPTTVYCYPIHMGPWPRPLNYHPDDWLIFPMLLKNDQSPWWTFDLAPEEVARKNEAIRANKSQMADHGYWLVSLARKNELFTTPSPIFLNRSQWNVAHQVVPHAGTDAYNTGASTGHLTAVTFSTDADALLVQFHLTHRQRFGLSFFADGYRHDKEFAKMPKLLFIWEWNLLRMEDSGVPMPLNGASAEHNEDGVLMRIPWTVLGDPERLLVQAHGMAGDVPVSETGWQVLLR